MVKLRRKAHWSNAQFRDWLERTGLTWKEAADELGVNISTISAYCSDPKQDRHRIVPKYMTLACNWIEHQITERQK